MNCIIINISVSVPCRGTTFLNPLKICKDYNTSFRPLSGNYISQSFNGVYYERGIHCFRPLSGNYISQCITITVKEILDNVSVPCRGTTFLNMYHLEYHILLFCFRPLSGNYISQFRQEKISKLCKLQVSVPCRGTTFLNRINGFCWYLACQFPSPVGELHFSILPETQVQDILHPVVSVPCRGTTFLN